VTLHGELIDQSGRCLDSRVDMAVTGRLILIAQCSGESMIAFNLLFGYGVHDAVSAIMSLFLLGLAI